MDPQEFKGNQPTFQPVKYFNGTVEAWGMVKNRWGSVQKRFYARFEGRKSGSDSVRVDETLYYADGTTDTRVYEIRKKSNRNFTIRTADMEDVGTGIRYGNAVRWNYTLNVDVNGSTWPLSFEDWMILQDRKTMLNEAWFSYFGVQLGKVIITFRKSDGSLVEPPYSSRVLRSELTGTRMSNLKLHRR